MLRFFSHVVYGVVQPDGKIVLANYVQNVADYDLAIFRFNANGSPDTSLDGDGRVITDLDDRQNFAYGVAVQSDGKTDIAVFRPSTGEWLILRSENYSFYGFNFGLTNDLPVPGDYDGDGKMDAAVFRPAVSAWYLQRSTSGFQSLTFGNTTDQPIPNSYVR